MSAIKVNQKKANESFADYYYRLEGGNTAQNQNSHLYAMESALAKCVANKKCEYSQFPNGSGTIHSYVFPKGEMPKFSTLSQDVFNQNVISEAV